MKQACEGIRTSWPWKGYPCGAIAKYEYKGKRYCAVHYAKAVKKDEAKEPYAEGKEER